MPLCVWQQICPYPYPRVGGTYCSLAAAGRFWARKGDAYVAQDVRGKWRSEGEWEPFGRKASEGYNILDWIAAQQRIVPAPRFPSRITLPVHPR